MIKEVYGDIFSSNANLILIPVNTVGVMGKGLALQFKEKYPDGFVAYRRMCQKGEIGIGKPAIWNKFMFFATKEHWKNKSKIEYIEKGLDWIINNQDNLIKNGYKTLAIPPLGSGLGGLHWSDVKNLILTKFANTSFDITIYNPIPEFEHQEKYNIFV